MAQTLTTGAVSTAVEAIIEVAATDAVATAAEPPQTIKATTKAATVEAIRSRADSRDVLTRKHLEYRSIHHAQRHFYLDDVRALTGSTLSHTPITDVSFS